MLIDIIFDLFYNIKNDLRKYFAMKKFLSIILCVVVVASAFVACSKAENNDAEGDKTEVYTSEVVTTDDAIIKEADAINLIQSYSAKELGLTEEEYKECSFMVASSGIELDGKYYIKVIATVKTEHKDGENVTYTFDNKGEYYISYNGKQILQKDMKSEEEKYSDMKVKEVPTTASIDE